MSFRPFILVSACLCLLVAGCGRLEAPSDAWYRKVKPGTFRPVPFSHDLHVLGYDGWRLIGKLPPTLASADALKYRLWVEEEWPLDEGQDIPEPTIAEGILEPRPDRERRLDLDILVQREWADGAPVYPYQTLLNQKRSAGTLHIPEGYRFELVIEEPASSIRIKSGEPVLLATAKLRSWSRSGGPNTTFTLSTTLFHWYLQLDPIVE